jgi:hypothetical protein
MDPEIAPARNGIAAGSCCAVLCVTGLVEAHAAGTACAAFALLGPAQQ